MGPHPSTSAWLGDLDDLCGDFAVHGLYPEEGGPRSTPDGLLVNAAPGRAEAVRFA